MINTTEELAFREFEKIGDDKLFPNHTNKDIWVSGFKSGAETNIAFAEWLVKNYKCRSYVSENMHYWKLGFPHTRYTTAELFIKFINKES